MKNYFDISNKFRSSSELQLSRLNQTLNRPPQQIMTLNTNPVLNITTASLPNTHTTALNIPTTNAND